MHKPLIVIFSEPSELGSYYINSLAYSTGCFVAVLKSDKKEWFRVNLQESSSIRFFSHTQILDLKPQYVIFVNGFEKKSFMGGASKNLKNLELSYKLAKKTNSRLQLVLPKEVNIKVIQKVQEIATNFIPKIYFIEKNFDTRKVLEALTRGLFSYWGRVSIETLSIPSIESVPETPSILTIPTQIPQKQSKPRPSISVKMPPLPPLKKFRKKILLSLGTFSFVVLLPFLFLLASFLITLTSLLSLRLNKPLFSLNLNSPAKSFLGVGKNLSLSYSKVPLLSIFAGQGISLATNLEDLILLEERVANLLNNGKLLSQKILLDDENVDIAKVSRDLSLGFTDIYKTLSFMEGRNNGNLWFLDALEKQESITRDDLKNYILEAGKISQELENLLSGETPKTYMILLQNNMELRPTGGFIGSFALVTFSKGALIDTSIMDVYSADGQLKGHVEPPEEIKTHLNEANWYLRDSNWDPDFPTSANRAMWFLEKELDRKVEGVLAIDLEFVKELLKLTGPVEMPEFSLTIDEKNLYEKVQYQVENEFFPGSHQKANLLSALSEKIMMKLKNSEVSSVGFWRVLLKNLNQKHVQVYLNNSNAQDSISNLSWSGEVAPSSIWGGFVDANLGVNKANYYITRKQSLAVTLSPSKTEYELKVEYVNNAPVSASQWGKYKTYARVLASKNSFFGKGKITSLNEEHEVLTETNAHEHWMEGGVLLEVMPGERKTLTMRWTTPTGVDTANPGKVEVLWRKQAGTKGDDFVFEVNKPFFLTQTHQSQYNTILERDYKSFISW